MPGLPYFMPPNTPAFQSLHVPDPARHCRYSALIGAWFAAPSHRGAADVVACCCGVQFDRAGLADTALGDFAPHRPVACTHRSPRQPGAGGAGAHWRHHGAVQQLGADAGAVVRIARRGAAGCAAAPRAELPRVAAPISPRSLLSAPAHFEQLLIEGAQLEVRRDAQGRILVGRPGVLSGTDGRRCRAPTGSSAARCRDPRRHRCAGPTRCTTRRH